MSERSSGAGAPSGSTPVLIRHVQRPFDDCDSLARDVSAVVQCPSKPTRKAWAKYPERTYRTPDGDACVSFLEWARERGEQSHIAANLKADDFVPTQIRDQLGAWRASLMIFETGVLAFESRRYNTLLGARANKAADVGHLRKFDMSAHVEQLVAIRSLGGSVTAADALVAEAEDEISRAECEQIQRHMTSLHDSALDTTHISLRSRLALLDRELAEIKVVNELTTVAQRERVNGGASVPLRLARRGDRYVLKPAATRSLFENKQKRARTEAASLALLLGLPASSAITLNVLDERGFGRPGNSFLNADAPHYDGEGEGRQWVLARARDLMYWKDEGEKLLEVIDDMRERRHGSNPVRLVPDDALIEETPAVTSEPPPLPKSSPPPRYDRFGHLVERPLSKQQRETHEWISALCRPLATVWDNAETRDEIVQRSESRFDPTSVQTQAISKRSCRIAANLTSAKADPHATKCEQRRDDFARMEAQIKQDYSPGKSVVCAIQRCLDLLRIWAESFEVGPASKRVLDMASEMVWADFSVAFFEELDHCETTADLSACMLKAAQAIDPVDIAYQSLVVPAGKPGMRDALMARQRAPGEAGN